MTPRIPVKEILLASFRLWGRFQVGLIATQLSIPTFVLLISACSSRVDYAVANSAPPASINAININTATVNDLERLPHVGPTTAEAIVAFRRDHGQFRRPEQLMLIRGVSETRFAEIRHLITAR